MATLWRPHGDERDDRSKYTRIVNFNGRFMLSDQLLEGVKGSITVLALNFQQTDDMGQR